MTLRQTMMSGVLSWIVAGRQAERGLRLRHHRHRSRCQRQWLGHALARRENHGETGRVRRVEDYASELVQLTGVSKVK